MQEHLVLTVTSHDKPGVIEAIAQSISAHNGNWLESKLAQLAGKFVGVIRVSIQTEHVQPLETSLQALHGKGIYVVSEIEGLTENLKKLGHSASFHALGPDRQGIIKELSSAFASHHINVEELDTTLSSMPYSGEPLFEASGRILMPDAQNIDDLHSHLDEIANDLGIDISVKLNTQ